MEDIPSAPPPVYPKGSRTPAVARRCQIPYGLPVSDAESSEFHALNLIKMAGFFASLQANRSIATANAQPTIRIYGDQYVPKNERKLTANELGGRKVLAVRVNQRQQVNRQGSPYLSKEAWAFVTGPDGKPSTARVYLKLRNDSPLQVGQWLDPDTLTVANMEQAGKMLNGTYVVKYDEIKDDKVNPDFIAYCTENGIDLTV